MLDDSELKTAQRLRDEAAELNAAADKKLAEADYKFGQADHRRREIAAIEKSIAERERALKQAGEPEFLARVAAADKALADAKALKADYNAVKHGAAQALVEINEREKRRERSEAA
jgi:hypothetical protein